MAIYIWLVSISVVLTLMTFLHRTLLRHWYNIWLALPLLVGWLLAATVLYFLLLYLISLSVDKAEPVRKRSPFFRFLLNQTVWLILHLGRVDIHCTGLEKLKDLPPFLLVANHCSNFDPLIAIAACPKLELAYIAKPEIFHIPITGRIAHKCFFLPIDRVDNRSALSTIKYAAKLLQKGVVSFGVYPEGTRSKTGELLPFRNGAFQIAKRAGAPVVIAKTTGTDQIAHRFARRRTVVRLDVLDVLDGAIVANQPTQKTGDYARTLMLQNQQITATEKEGNERCNIRFYITHMRETDEVKRAPIS